MTYKDAGYSIMIGQTILNKFVKSLKNKDGSQKVQVVIDETNKGERK
jgi:hypothetical protein